jgi:hypothetical protein
MPRILGAAAIDDLDARSAQQRKLGGQARSVIFGLATLTRALSGRARFRSVVQKDSELQWIAECRYGGFADWALGPRRCCESMLAATRVLCAETFRGTRSDASACPRGLALARAKNPDRLS